ncbi:hypothetical protein HYQ44_013284 [Verticillium longisporum]|nr:hypothetical protein HYQ44_013284 [Verticillium longisporum]
MWRHAKPSKRGLAHRFQQPPRLMGLWGSTRSLTGRVVWHQSQKGRFGCEFFDLVDLCALFGTVGVGDW